MFQKAWRDPYMAQLIKTGLVDSDNDGHHSYIARL